MKSSLGLEVVLNCIVVTLFTYFQQVGGIEVVPVPVEITYGIERIAMYAQGVEPMRYLREVRVPAGEEHKCGDTVTVADFSEVTAVDVIGTSKGKGFQGTIKRWNFSRGPMTHGSRNQRRPGSIGQCAYPARVRKGLHMYGHMGAERVTVKNLKLVRVDAEQNLMLIKGAVPGGKNALVQVRMA